MENLLNPLTAGMLPNDHAIELFGDRKTREVFWIQNGKVKDFFSLPDSLIQQLSNKLIADKKARQDLENLKWFDALQEFAFCLFGLADDQPDVVAGQFQESENFRCNKPKCHCLQWQSKSIHYNNVDLTSREIEVMDLLKTGIPDKQVADELGIALSTLNVHKKNLMKKLNAKCKVDLVINGVKSKIIQ